ncbi:hypothetical protein RUND412_008909 [Rhizina undulata]
MLFLRQFHRLLYLSFATFLAPLLAVGWNKEICATIPLEVAGESICSKYSENDWLSGTWLGPVPQYYDVPPLQEDAVLDLFISGGGFDQEIILELFKNGPISAAGFRFNFEDMWE